MPHCRKATVALGTRDLSVVRLPFVVHRDGDGKTVRGGSVDAAPDEHGLSAGETAKASGMSSLRSSLTAVLVTPAPQYVPPGDTAAAGSVDTLCGTENGALQTSPAVRRFSVFVMDATTPGGEPPTETPTKGGTLRLALNPTGGVVDGGVFDAVDASASPSALKSVAAVLCRSAEPADWMTELAAKATFVASAALCVSLLSAVEEMLASTDDADARVAGSMSDDAPDDPEVVRAVPTLLAMAERAFESAVDDEELVDGFPDAAEERRFVKTADCAMTAATPDDSFMCCAEMINAATSSVLAPGDGKGAPAAVALYFHVADDVDVTEGVDDSEIDAERV